ncbi:MAG: sulfite exporter TauE/SafE family protein [Gammaproteobacteria bacterium]|nr:sulfite exporter TauE/SafE family protein [Gammaproteobacteria bacterium]
METLTLSLSAALLMGLAFGAGPCNITCLPFLGPVFLREGNRGGTDWHTIVPFSLGRLTSYAMLGAIAGSFGYAATVWIESGRAAQILGIATMIIGLLMLRGKGGAKSCQRDHDNQAATVKREMVVQSAIPKKRVTGPLFSLSLFGMGVGMALNPCVPLATVLTVAATMATPANGLLLGLSFGVGAVAIPTIIFGIAVAHFGAQIRYHLSHWGDRIEQIAGGMLILLGSVTALGFVQI